jgi:hypothetical protein
VTTKEAVMSDSGNTGPGVDEGAGKENRQPGEKPSLQEHHDPETEEDTASGGAAD